MTHYDITTFDVCVPGFERLRSNAEFILVASVWPDMSHQDLQTAWLDDMQSCDRPDNFDFDAVRTLVTNFAASINMKRALEYVEPSFDDDSGEGCHAYLFIRVCDDDDDDDGEG